MQVVHVPGRLDEPVDRRMALDAGRPALGRPVVDDDDLVAGRALAVELGQHRGDVLAVADDEQREAHQRRPRSVSRARENAVA